MLFNSFEFAFFLPTVFVIYWFLAGNNTRNQNIVLAITSYFFYGFWDYRFLFLMFFSTSLDYFIGKRIYNSNNKAARKRLLIFSLVVNLTLLGVFKYYNFFIESFVDAFNFFGYGFSPKSLNLILPVGISFYTFQTLSYTIDVYKNKIKPVGRFIDFVSFVSFFPQLVAGPIERASNLMPQFEKRRFFNQTLAVDGLRQALWGLFKKLVIADNCAPFVNDIFDNHTDMEPMVLVLGAILFAFQIYGDFSGYSDIAIGISKLFGINLMQNFSFPYFSRDIAEFWRRWHISLSSWFRDYLYIPIGGSKGNNTVKIRNVLIIFLISGLWHGANWTFVLWGALNAIYFIPYMLLNLNRKNTSTIAQDSFLPNLGELFQMLFTFSIVCIAWVFFRANSVSHAIEYLKGIFIPHPYIDYTFNQTFITTFLFIGFLLSVEWFNKSESHGLSKLNQNFSRPFRWIVYLTLIFVTANFGGSQQNFIYFQF